MSICSLVVHARPENLASVGELLSAMEGVEIHGSNPDGKLVVVIDHPDREVCSRTVMDMQNVPGVINASLVYDYIDDPGGDREQSD